MITSSEIPLTAVFEGPPQLIDSAGFTILEVIVAMGMLGVVLVSTGNAFVGIAARNSAMEVRSAAIHAAQITLDELRQVSPTDLPATGIDDSRMVTVDTKEFSVLVHYCSKPALCTSASTRHILVEILFRSEKVFDVETVYTTLR